MCRSGRYWKIISFLALPSHTRKEMEGADAKPQRSGGWAKNLLHVSPFLQVNNILCFDCSWERASTKRGC